MPSSSDDDPTIITQAFRKRDVKGLLEQLERLEPRFKYTPVFVHIRVTRMVLEGLQKASQQKENAEEIKQFWDQLGQRVFDLNLAISRST